LTDVTVSHWNRLAAADFFAVEVLTIGGLVRYFVLFVMRLKTRTVEIAGITCQPTDAWMKQTARKLTDPQDSFKAFHGQAERSRVQSRAVAQRSGDVGGRMRHHLMAL
jgi:hypothetical protein